MVSEIYRTHSCNALRITDVTKEVKLCGWINKIRTFGKLTFIDLRDRYGMTQIVCKEDFSEEILKELRHEFVLQVTGIVVERSHKNSDLPTGDIEITAQKINILNKCQQLPLDLENAENNTDEIRLKHRYLDLRRPYMQDNLIVRHKAAFAAREYLVNQDFLEIETPLLVRSTPEGARDYIVPSRVHNGKAYSLPQSPQIYKQLLMVSGFDKYFQLARCLRDEDLRADRQPEFTQIDVEMSFVTHEEVFKVAEGLCQNIFRKTIGKELTAPFEQMTYSTAMNKYGIDKPDLRFGLEHIDITDLAKKSESSILNSAELVKILVIGEEFSNKKIKKLEEFVKRNKAKGLMTLTYNSDSKTIEGPLAKFLSDDAKQEIIVRITPQLDTTKPIHTIFGIADKKSIAHGALAALRLKLGEDFELYDPSDFKFVWIIDFPLFEWDEEENRWVAAHHMFTMPKKETLEFLESDPGKVFADCYDLVLNGVELASGSIRIHDSTIQKRVMHMMNIKEEDAKEKFGFLLEAFQYGAPPHGGFAIGFDRIVAMIKQLKDIREVIAFPKNKQAVSPMDASPSAIGTEVLDLIGMDIRRKDE